MKISASVKSQKNSLETNVQTNDTSKQILIKPKSNGQGSLVNGGELLLLSVAICFCNDIYREAAKLNINIDQVEVIATGEFGAEGGSGFNFEYQTNIIADASDNEIQYLIEHTDKVAEVHNTLRNGVNITIRKANRSEA
jgi:uncharacterized OsmC-like protein